MIFQRFLIFCCLACLVSHLFLSQFPPLSPRLSALAVTMNSVKLLPFSAREAAVSRCVPFFWPLSAPYWTPLGMPSALRWASCIHSQIKHNALIPKMVSSSPLVHRLIQPIKMYRPAFSGEGFFFLSVTDWTFVSPPNSNVEGYFLVRWCLQVEPLESGMESLGMNTCKERQEKTIPLLVMWAHSKKVALCTARHGSSPHHSSATLDFQNHES